MMNKNGKNDNSPSFLTAVLVLFILIAAVYSNSIKNPFYYDDIKYIVQSDWLSDTSLLINLFDRQKYYHLFAESTYRPGATFLFFPLKAAFGLEPSYWRLFNLFFHLANCCLLFLLLLRFKISRWLSLLAVSLFAVHTIHTTSINVISMFTTLVGNFLCLLAFYWYLRKKTTWRVGSIIMFILACSIKETYLVLPALLFIYCWWDEQKEFSLKKFILGHADYLLAACLILFINFVVMKSTNTYQFKYPGGSIFSAQMTFYVVLIYYLKIFFVPLGLTPVYEFPVFKSILAWQVIASLLILVLIGSIIVYGFKRKKTFAFFLIWFFIFLLPMANIIPSPVILSEWFLHMPLMGLIPGILLLIMHLFEKTKINGEKPVIIIGILFLVFLSVLTVKRNVVWQDPYTLWMDTIKKSPNSRKSWMNLGTQGLYNKGRYKEALKVYQTIAELFPNYGAVHRNLGHTYFILNQKEKARESYFRAIAIQPIDNRAYLALGILHMNMGDNIKAEKYLLKSQELNPRNPRVNKYLSKVYRNLGKYEKAEQIRK